MQRVRVEAIAIPSSNGKFSWKADVHYDETRRVVHAPAETEMLDLTYSW
jgi:hypothetical protein